AQNGLKSVGFGGAFRGRSAASALAPPSAVAGRVIPIATAQLARRSMSSPQVSRGWDHAAFCSARRSWRGRRRKPPAVAAKSRCKPRSKGPPPPSLRATSVRNALFPRYLLRISCDDDELAGPASFIE